VEDHGCRAHVGERIRWIFRVASMARSKSRYPIRISLCRHGLVEDRSNVSIGRGIYKSRSRKTWSFAGCVTLGNLDVRIHPQSECSLCRALGILSSQQRARRVSQQRWRKDLEECPVHFRHRGAADLDFSPAIRMSCSRACGMGSASLDDHQRRA